jgi:RNA polymerase sigma-70 factor (ECF subfamily)
MEKSDGQLVSESILGIQGSFADLVNRHITAIYAFCYRLVGNSHAAEDCTQETFIKVWRSLDKYKPEFAFRTWIFVIARNTTTDYLRKKKSIPFSLMLKKSNTNYEDNLEDMNRSPEEQTGITLTKEMLEITLTTMHENYKTVLILHYQEGMTFQEISEIMRHPLNTVKSWHRRALAELKETLKKNPLQ